MTVARSLLALLLLLAVAALPPAAAEDPAPDEMLLPESLALSPDGATLWLAWRGDLWTAPSAGGRARRMTGHPAHDAHPRVSPDGRQVAFTSDRSGVEQVHVMPVEGGDPLQVTWHSEGSRLQDWFPDGRALLVRGQRDHDWRGASRLLRVPVSGGHGEELLFDAECGAGAVSPDGRRVAFTREGMGWTRKGYHGPKASQLWLHDLAGGAYTRLSRGDRGELWPLWAGPDGLYYVSQASGAWNLWRRDLAADSGVQVTHFEDDGVSSPCISADGSTLAFRRLGDVYVLDARAGAAPRKVRLLRGGEPAVEVVDRRTQTKARQAAFSDDAREVALVAGGDLWVMDTVLREPRRVTNTPAEEHDPVFTPDFQWIYFVSEEGLDPDIWRARRADPDRPWWENDEFVVERVTHDAALESDLELVPGGTRLAYLSGGDLWTLGLDGGAPERHVPSFADLQWSFSPDGAWVAYAKPDDDFNWDVWIAPLDGSRAPFNVSVHPDNDSWPAWSPDGRILAFTGRRWTQETDVCYVYLRAQDDETDRRDRTLEKALKKMAGRKPAGAPAAKPKPAAPAQPTPAAPAQPEPTAPAKPAAPPAPRDPLEGTWSGHLAGPDPLPADGLGLTLRFTRAEDGSYAVEVEVVGQFSGTASGVTFEAQAGTVVFDLPTPLGALRGEGRVEGEHMRGTWRIESAMDGTFEVQRAAAAAAQPEESPAAPPESAAAPGPKPLEIDFAGLTDRVHRVPIPDSEESGLLWSPDSRKLAFRAKVEGKEGLYTVEFPDGLTPRLWSALRGEGARWLKEGNQLAWLVDGRPATLSAEGKAESLPFQVRQEVVVTEEHRAAFVQAWRVMRDHWYDPALGGRDWDAVRAKYEPLAGACATAAELELVVNLMLGELNGSHLGYRSTRRGWHADGWRDVTGHLGCRFEDAWEGPGWKVRDVVPDTPAAEARHRLQPGDLVLAIDGRPVGPATNRAEVLTGDPQRTVEIKARAVDGAERVLRMRPTTYGDVRRHLYDLWIQRTRARVDEASGGRLGYLHVRSMDWSGFERFEAELYKVGHGKAALLIDVRDNGGGFTTDHLLTCLTQPRHAVTVPRGGGVGYPNDRLIYAPWTKPVVVLCNQNSFSNAEIFAHAIQTLHRGPVVGVQTAGGVISTGATGIMELGSLRIPFRGWFLREDGEDMEMNGCVPDHEVWPEPQDHAAGLDRQVEKAIEVGLAEAQAYARRPVPAPRYGSSR